MTAFVLFVLLGVPICYGKDCQDLHEAAPDALLTFLRRTHPNAQNADCITFAIRALGDQRYEPAVDVLAGLLDFRRPATELERTTVTLHTFYPASIALEQIGQSCLPQLLKVITDESFSAVARENAINVWMEIFKYKRAEGVASLKRAAKGISDPSARQKLDWALNYALKWCGPGDLPKCKEAANSGYSN